MRKLLSSAQYEKRLWKNGRGTTHVVMLCPSEAGDEFKWRISLADLNESGPFSVFPEIDRTLVLLEGSPVILKQASQEILLPLLSPYSFDGALKTHAVVKSTGKDFNLMCRRGQAKGNVSVISGSRVLPIDENFFGVLSVVENLRVDGVLMKKYDFYFIQDEKKGTISIDSPETSYLVVSIRA